ncbi:MAG TPA: ABC transporter ATP-binding protein [Alphaproteobacteria bacterium]|jgi:ABC-2 type transport system ATP-binding protein
MSHPNSAQEGWPDYAVEISGLTKTYAAGKSTPAKVALRGVDLQIPRGSFFGLLGPNGAGKSTTINILAGLVNKTGGDVRIWGHDIDHASRAARLSIGIVPQELNIDPFFTPRALLELQAGFYGVPANERRTDEILRAVGLTEQAEAYARTLSGGMRRRLLIGKAMLHSPPILVLDEPTAGVDLELRQSLWAYMKAMNEQGTTILLTTHYLEEAEKLCDRIAIIDRGEVVACDTTSALLHRLDRKELIVTAADDISAVPAGLERFAVELLPPRRLSFRYQPSRTQIGEIFAAMRDAGIVIADVTTEESRLEDIFLELTGGRRAAGLADAAAAS